jgi:hypothetical protein
MLHEDNRYRIRVEKPILLLTSNGECHYQFDIGSWLVFDTLGEASEFLRERLEIMNSAENRKENGGA